MSITAEGALVSYEFGRAGGCIRWLNVTRKYPFKIQGVQKVIDFQRQRIVKQWSRRCFGKQP